MYDEARRGARIALSTLLALATLSHIARAGELVTLRNGYSIQCTHHAEVEGRIRLFSSSGEDSYIEFPPEKIANVELVPDPPALAPHVSSDNQALSAPQPPRAATAEAHLTPGDLQQILARAGREHNLDVDLLASVVKAESGGNARAVSRTGARGLMQLMPTTAASLGVQDSFEPEQNVRGGSAYLDALLTYYKDNLALALAAYNAGPGAVDRYHGNPPYSETRAYVARVIHEFNHRVLARRAQARQMPALSSPDAVAVLMSSR
jgi:soluble lytic murein transglycosylase-like protein